MRRWLSTGSPTVLDDATVSHIARLSLLHFEPGTPAFARVKADMEKILTLANTMDASEASVDDMADSMTAAARVVDLRKDEVTEGGIDTQQALLHHSKHVYEHAPYFVVPKR